MKQGWNRARGGARVAPTKMAYVPLGLLGLLLTLVLFLLAACEVPRVGVQVLQPVTPGPSPTPWPTLCAHARIAGKVCTAGSDVYIATCCPEWSAVTTADEHGAFAFDSITAGTYTVTAGLRSRRVILHQCDSQVSVDLCAGPNP